MHKIPIYIYYDKAIFVFLCMEDLTTIFQDHCDLDSQTCKDGRSRTWMILTYDDNDQFKNVHGRLKDLDWDFAGRIHDQEKKPHYHIVCLFKNGRKIADVAQDLNIDPRWLCAWDKKKRALRYLCHKDDQEKFQYSPDQIFGTIAETAIQLCSKGDVQSESQSVADLLAIFDSYEGLITYSSLIKTVAEAGLYSVFRRMGNFAIKMIDEHNEQIREKWRFEKLTSEKTEDLLFKGFLEKSTSKDFVEKCKDLDQVGFPILPLDD